MTFEDVQLNAAGKLAEIIAASPPRVESAWHVHGRIGSGKTTLMRRAADQLPQHFIPIRVSAPPLQLDSGAVALVSLASGLKQRSLINGQIGLFESQSRRSDEKLEQVQQWVTEFSDNIVLFADAPYSWVPRDQQTYPDASGRLAEQFSRWICYEAPVRRVIAASWLPPAPQFRLHPVECPAVDDATQLLALSKWPSEFARYIEQLSAIAADFPASPTPLYIRLLLGLAIVTSVDYVRKGLPQFIDHDVVLKRLIGLLGRGDRWPNLCRSLSRLSLSRTALPQHVVEGLCDDLNWKERLVLNCCLVEDNGQQFLDPVVRAAIRQSTGANWKLSIPEAIKVHATLAEYYAAPSQGGALLLDRMEAFFHEALRADQPNIRGLPFFPEQLHAAGRTLSQEFRAYDKAAALFQRAIDIDPCDDYAHHYLAFNLDAQGVQPEQVEEEYQTAIRINLRHPWWRSRWITYLVTRGRIPDAKREWAAALDALSVSRIDSPPELFQSLHKWVARWLLHWVKLDFAQAVLDAVPPRADDAGFRALRRLLRALREAERGQAVFPLGYGWRETPHLPLLDRLETGKKRKSWSPARVQTKDDIAVELLVAQRNSDPNAKPQAHSYDFSHQEIGAAAIDFSWEDVTPGRFAELGFYGEDGEMRMMLHPDVPWVDRDLPPLVFNPERYMTKGSA